MLSLKYIIKVGRFHEQYGRDSQGYLPAFNVNNLTLDESSVGVRLEDVVDEETGDVRIGQK